MLVKISSTEQLYSSCEQLSRQFCFNCCNKKDYNSRISKCLLLNQEPQKNKLWTHCTIPKLSVIRYDIHTHFKVDFLSSFLFKGCLCDVYTAIRSSYDLPDQRTDSERIHWRYKVPLYSRCECQNQTNSTEIYFHDIKRFNTSSALIKHKIVYLFAAKWVSKPNHMVRCRCTSLLFIFSGFWRSHLLFQL